MNAQCNKSEAGRALAALRRQVEGTCVMCGAATTGTTKRRYCTDRCRMRAHHLRRQAENMETLDT